MAMLNGNPMTGLAASDAPDTREFTEGSGDLDSKLKAIREALDPLTVESSAHDMFFARGTDAQARSAAILRGRGLPGDPGANKTQYFFNLEDGRRVRVYRSTYKTGPMVFVRVERTQAEDAAKKSEQEQERLEKVLSRLKREGVDDVAALRQDMRRVVERITADLRYFVVQGNASCKSDGVATCRLHGDDAASALKALGHIERIFQDATIVRCGCAAPATLKLIQGGGAPTQQIKPRTLRSVS